MYRATVIIPTYKEEANIEEHIKRTTEACPDCCIFVVDDNSPDQTQAIVKQLSKTYPVRLITRNERGLSSAIVEGIKHAETSSIVVIDADLQHPPEVIPHLLSALDRGNVIAIGSRYCKGGGIEGWPFFRRLVSRIANSLGFPIVPRVKDRTSGFFAFKREAAPQLSKLNIEGFKILLEFLALRKACAIAEVPFTFTIRAGGESKFGFKQVWEYIRQLVRLYSQIPRGITTEDYEWHSFHKGHFIQKWWKKSVAKKIWNFIPPGEGTLLDVGCGSSPMIAEYTNAVGLDLNPLKLKFLTANLPSHSFANMDARNLAIASKSFDGVVCSEVLEHISDPELVIREISRVLKDGGKAVIATPDYSRFLWRIAEKFTPYEEDHVYKFTRDNLEELCARHNLTPVAHKYVAKCDLVELFLKSA
jgi:glycosyltransferase involved in cell wall biosynthesis